VVKLSDRVQSAEATAAAAAASAASEDRLVAEEQSRSHADHIAGLQRQVDLLSERVASGSADSAAPTAGKAAKESTAEDGMAAARVQAELSALESSQTALAARVEQLTQELRDMPHAAMAAESPKERPSAKQGKPSPEGGEAAPEAVSRLAERLAAVERDLAIMERDVAAAAKERESVSALVGACSLRIAALEGCGGSEAKGAKETEALEQLKSLEERMGKVEVAAGRSVDGERRRRDSVMAAVEAVQATVQAGTRAAAADAAAVDALKIQACSLLIMLTHDPRMQHHHETTIMRRWRRCCVRESGCCMSGVALVRRSRSLYSFPPPLSLFLSLPPAFSLSLSLPFPPLSLSPFLERVTGVALSASLAAL
jgi:hypothetical protein